MCGRAQELERPGDMLPAADDPAVWLLLDSGGNCIDKHNSTWNRGMVQVCALADSIGRGVLRFAHHPTWAAVLKAAGGGRYFAVLAACGLLAVAA